MSNSFLHSISLQWLEQGQGELPSCWPEQQKCFVFSKRSEPWVSSDEFPSECLQCPACLEGSFHKQFQKSLYCFSWYSPLQTPWCQGIWHHGSCVYIEVTLCQYLLILLHCHLCLISYVLMSAEGSTHCLVSSQLPPWYWDFFSNTTSAEVFPLFFVPWGLSHFAVPINWFFFLLH